MRVARIIQRMQSLKELRKLVSMMATCMKTLGRAEMRKNPETLIGFAPDSETLDDGLVGFEMV